jgi:hypothetical protein
MSSFLTEECAPSAPITRSLFTTVWDPVGLGEQYKTKNNFRQEKNKKTKKQKKNKKMTKNNKITKKLQCESDLLLIKVNILTLVVKVKVDVVVLLRHSEKICVQLPAINRQNALLFRKKTKTKTNN